MFTRSQYLNSECTHRQYYAQFVNQYLLDLVQRTFGAELKTEASLKSIPLNRWDALTNCLVSHSSNAKLKEAGDYPTLAGRVCILKEAARQAIEQSKAGS